MYLKYNVNYILINKYHNKISIYRNHNKRNKLKYDDYMNKIKERHIKLDYSSSYNWIFELNRIRQYCNWKYLKNVDQLFLYSVCIELPKEIGNKIKKISKKIGNLINLNILRLNGNKIKFISEKLKI